MIKYDTDKVLADIFAQIKWFDDNGESTNISAVSQHLDNFNILLARFNEVVMDSFDVDATLEDEYKTAYAIRVKELVDSGMSVNKAENEVLIELSAKKKQWREATSTYKRLKSRLDRFDKIGDGKKQFVSVVKMTELKNV